MSLTDELDDRGLVPTAGLVTLSLVSANRGAKLLFNTDLVSAVFGGYAGLVFGVAGVVGLLTLGELLFGLEVVPDEFRL